MYSGRKFTRPQVAHSDSVTEPVQVGDDGRAAFTAYSFTSSRDPHRRYYGVQFQMSTSDTPSTSSRMDNDWAGISNVGDGLGRFGHNFLEPVGACVSGLPKGAWVRGFIYRLDGDDASTARLAVRTSA